MIGNTDHQSLDIILNEGKIMSLLENIGKSMKAKVKERKENGFTSKK